VIRRLVVLALLVGGALLLEPLRVPTEGVIAPRSLFLFGILLLAADTLGAVASDLRLPRIVGYLVAGMVLGPSLSGLVPNAVFDDLTMMKRLAVGLIGLLAGMELRMDDLRKRWRSILAILAFQTLFVILVVVPAFVVASRWMPFVSGMALVPLSLVALLFATMLAVNSPMVTLALIEETRAHGPVAKTTLGVVLVADVVVIILFTIAYSLTQTVLTGAGAGGALDVVLRLVREVGGSLLAGGVIGGILALYVRYVKRELVLFAVVLVFATEAAAGALHFELLLSLLVAGFVVENGAPVDAEPLLHALKLVSGPVFVIFFAMTGGELVLRVFVSLWPVVVAVAVVRALALVYGNRAGARLGGAEPEVERLGWMGLVPQAGVALGFASLVAEGLPGVGVGLQALTVGIITLNTGVGPVLFRLALQRAGEVGAE